MEHVQRIASRVAIGSGDIETSGSQRRYEPDYPRHVDARLLRIAGVCVLALMIVCLDTTVVFVAQRTFVTVFNSTEAVVAWTMTGYVLALATVTPLAGWAADRFGAKRLFIGSVLTFTVGSVLCATAPNIMLLIIFRVCQGFGGGVLMPLILTIVTREAGPGRAGRVMAVVGVPALLGQIGGPILGGWLVHTYGWKWIFLINLPVGLGTAVLAAIVFAKDQPRPSEVFDFIGVLLLLPGLATLLYGLSSLPGRGTAADPEVCLPATIGVVLITGFVFHALYRTDHPLIDMRLFANRVVTLANAVMFLFIVAFCGSGLIYPSYFQELLHHTPLQAGLATIPVGLGALVGVPLAGRSLDKHGPGKVLMVGAILVSTGAGIFAYGVANRVGYFPILVAGMTIVGLGVGFMQMPASVAAVQSLAPHQIARGSALVSVNQQIAASVAYALMSVILTIQFSRSENVSTAHKIANLQKRNRFEVPPDPAVIPRRALSPDFAVSVMRDLSHAYTVVFVVAFALTALTLIPAALLRKPGSTHPAARP
ncbi:DHA2 family efflux MFS transporter permease subunit [Mycobacterium riyadhense]|nr:DHA2 family efflux MFS transporter permease subunit [Mycobacterium riyadhense]MCV7144355.1 DHA2 family efflux MFS transporter permease subunit [Mycobacterium riyadhense]VTP03523.1 Multidrug export protein EmrB [Mycobacterium riyadhense]